MAAAEQPFAKFYEREQSYESPENVRTTASRATSGVGGNSHAVGDARKSGSRRPFARSSHHNGSSGGTTSSHASDVSGNGRSNFSTRTAKPRIPSNGTTQRSSDNAEAQAGASRSMEGTQVVVKQAVANRNVASDLRANAGRGIGGTHAVGKYDNRVARRQIIPRSFFANSSNCLNSARSTPPRKAEVARPFAESSSPHRRAGSREASDSSSNSWSRCGSPAGSTNPSGHCTTPLVRRYGSRQIVDISGNKASEPILQAATGGSACAAPPTASPHTDQLTSRTGSKHRLRTLDLTSFKAASSASSEFANALSSPPAPPLTSAATAAANLIPQVPGSWYPKATSVSKSASHDGTGRSDSSAENADSPNAAARTGNRWEKTKIPRHQQLDQRKTLKRQSFGSTSLDIAALSIHEKPNVNGPMPPEYIQLQFAEPEERSDLSAHQVQQYAPYANRQYPPGASSAIQQPPNDCDTQVAQNSPKTNPNTYYFSSPTTLFQPQSSYRRDNNVGASTSTNSSHLPPSQIPVPWHKSGMTTSTVPPNAKNAEGGKSVQNAIYTQSESSSPLTAPRRNFYDANKPASNQSPLGAASQMQPSRTAVAPLPKSLLVPLPVPTLRTGGQSSVTKRIPAKTKSLSSVNSHFDKHSSMSPGEIRETDTPGTAISSVSSTPQIWTPKKATPSGGVGPSSQEMFSKATYKMSPSARSANFAGNGAYNPTRAVDMSSSLMSAESMATAQYSDTWSESTMNDGHYGPHADHVLRSAGSLQGMPRSNDADRAGSDSHAELAFRNSPRFSKHESVPRPRSPPYPQEGLMMQAMTPKDALLVYADRLTPFERIEILDYPSVYFVGRTTAEKRGSFVPTKEGTLEGHGTENNYGYDDDRGDFQLVPHDHLCYRYEVIDTLGKGSFGQVVKAFDHANGVFRAVKIIRNKKRFHCQALVEVKILDCVNEWDRDDTHHIVRKTSHFYFRSHLCIAFELLSINMYEFIKNNSFQGFGMSLIRRFASQLLRTLSLLNDKNIVHCDLKPENILLTNPAKSGIKVIDFGSSCFENERVYTYIQSRFYRSPEVILEIPYTTGIDMWSLGCILAELYTGYPLFPGESEEEQLSCIIEVLGPPPSYVIDQSGRRGTFFDSAGHARPVINSKGKRRRPSSRPLHVALKCTDAGFIDFISRCLAWDPERRMTPQEGLQHPWITEVNAQRIPPPPVSANGATSTTRRRTLESNSLTSSASSLLLSAARRKEKKQSQHHHHHNHNHNHHRPSSQEKTTTTTTNTTTHHKTLGGTMSTVLPPIFRGKESNAGGGSHHHTLRNLLLPCSHLSPSSGSGGKPSSSAAAIAQPSDGSSGNARNKSEGLSTFFHRRR